MRSYLTVVFTLLFSAAASSGDNTKSPAFIAHRGLIRHAPENTLANFAACIHLKLGFEIDVQRSKDGQLVVIHDSTLERTTNGKGKVADSTLAQLRKLDAGSWFSPEFADQQIPTLAELFTLLKRLKADGVLIAVDVKVEDTEADIARLAKKHGVLPHLVFIGRAIRSHSVRRNIHKVDPKAHVATWAESPKDLTKTIADPNADWVYVRFVPTAKQVAEVHRSGKRVLLSGPNVVKPGDSWLHAFRAGVDAILTDYPLDCRLMYRSEMRKK